MVFVIGLCMAFVGFTAYTVTWLNRKTLCSVPSANSCRLVWSPFAVMVRESPATYWLFSVFYLVLLAFAAGLFTTEYKKYLMRYGIVPVTFIVAFLYSRMVEANKGTDIFGSMWCLLGVLYGVVAVMHI